MPDEVVQLALGFAKFEVLQIAVDGVRNLVQAADYPAVFAVGRGQWGDVVVGGISPLQADQHEAGGIPQLVGEVAASFQFAVGQAQVIARRGAG